MFSNNSNNPFNNNNNNVSNQNYADVLAEKLAKKTLQEKLAILNIEASNPENLLECCSQLEKLMVKANSTEANDISHLYSQIVTSLARSRVLHSKTLLQSIDITPLQAAASELKELVKIAGLELKNNPTHVGPTGLQDEMNQINFASDDEAEIEVGPSTQGTPEGHISDDTLKAITSIKQTTTSFDKEMKKKFAEDQNNMNFLIRLEVVNANSLAEALLVINRYATIMRYCVEQNDFHGAQACLSPLCGAFITAVSGSPDASNADYPYLPEEISQLIKTLSDLFSAAKRYKAFNEYVNSLPSNSPMVPLFNIISGNLEFGNMMLTNLSEATDSQKIELMKEVVQFIENTEDYLKRMQSRTPAVTDAYTDTIPWQKVSDRVDNFLRINSQSEQVNRVDLIDDITYTSSLYKNKHKNNNEQRKIYQKYKDYVKIDSNFTMTSNPLMEDSALLAKANKLKSMQNHKRMAETIEENKLKQEQITQSKILSAKVQKEVEKNDKRKSINENKIPKLRHLYKASSEMNVPAKVGADHGLEAEGGKLNRSKTVRNLRKTKSDLKNEPKNEIKLSATRTISKRDLRKTESEPQVGTLDNSDSKTPVLSASAPLVSIPDQPPSNMNDTPIANNNNNFIDKNNDNDDESDTEFTSSMDFSTRIPNFKFDSSASIEKEIAKEYKHPGIPLKSTKSMPHKKTTFSQETADSAKTHPFVERNENNNGSANSIESKDTFFRQRSNSSASSYNGSAEHGKIKRQQLVNQRRQTLFRNDSSISDTEEQGVAPSPKEIRSKLKNDFNSKYVIYKACKDKKTRETLRTELRSLKDQIRELKKKRPDSSKKSLSKKK